MIYDEFIKAKREKRAKRKRFKRFSRNLFILPISIETLRRQKDSVFMRDCDQWEGDVVKFRRPHKYKSK